MDNLELLQFDLSEFNNYPKSLAKYDSVVFTHNADQWINFVRFWRMFFYSFWALHPYYIEYTAITTFVSTAKKTNPNVKFIVMSSLGTLNPFWIPSLVLNTLFCGILKYKYLANEYLRQSGLNYIIMRPPKLMDSFDKLDKDLI